MVKSATLADDADLRQLLEDCLSRGSSSAWRTFVSQFHRLIQSTVIRTARRCGQLTPDAADDLVQEVYLRLCAQNYKVLRSFRSPEPKALFGLIQSVAVTTTLDHFRAWSAEKRGSGEDPLPLEAAILSAAGHFGTEGIERSILFDQIDRRLEEICPPDTLARDRRAFWLYFRQGFTAKNIAALPGIGLSDKGVESTIHRLTSQLKVLLGPEGLGEKGTSA